MGDRSGRWVLAGAVGAQPGEGISHWLAGAEHIWIGMGRDGMGWDGCASTRLWLFLNES